MIQIFLITLLAALLVLYTFFPNTWRSLMARDIEAYPYARRADHRLALVATRNPFRPSGPPVCMAKLIMQRHKINQSISRNNNKSKRSSPRLIPIPKLPAIHVPPPPTPIPTAIKSTRPPPPPPAPVLIPPPVHEPSHSHSIPAPLTLPLLSSHIPTASSSPPSSSSSLPLEPSPLHPPHPHPSIHPDSLRHPSTLTLTNTDMNVYPPATAPDITPTPNNDAKHTPILPTPNLPSPSPTPTRTSINSLPPLLLPLAGLDSKTQFDRGLDAPRSFAHPVHGRGSGGVSGVAKADVGDREDGGGREAAHVRSGPALHAQTRDSAHEYPRARGQPNAQVHDCDCDCDDKYEYANEEDLRLRLRGNGSGRGLGERDAWFTPSLASVSLSLPFRPASPLTPNTSPLNNNTNNNTTHPLNVNTNTHTNANTAPATVDVDVRIKFTFKGCDTPFVFPLPLALYPAGGGISGVGGVGGISGIGGVSGRRGTMMMKGSPRMKGGWRGVEVGEGALWVGRSIINVERQTSNIQ
ncbi:hypothetical protein PTI98_004703 [Pleurotus ostreatus]|nr:hypothetical protein PTI98_004703 [Pleurotus ostreatus]